MILILVVVCYGMTVCDIHLCESVKH